MKTDQAVNFIDSNWITVLKVGGFVSFWDVSLGSLFFHRMCVCTMYIWWMNEFFYAVDWTRFACAQPFKEFVFVLLLEKNPNARFTYSNEVGRSQLREVMSCRSNAVHKKVAVDEKFYSTCQLCAVYFSLFMPEISLNNYISKEIMQSTTNKSTLDDDGGVPRWTESCPNRDIERKCQLTNCSIRCVSQLS